MPIHRHLCLLLIEDSDDLQVILQFVLETISGWQVITAQSTQDCLTLAQEKNPDVILLDGYPDHTDMLAQLKADSPTRVIPVVCLVARDRLADQQQARQAGVTTIISKPFDPMRLVEKILETVQSLS